MKSLIIVTIVLAPSVLNAWEKPGEPDYAAITQKADLVVSGRVVGVILPSVTGELAEVKVAVNKVHKGQLSESSIVSMFHEPTEYRPKQNRGRLVHIANCPAGPRLLLGQSYTVWSIWDASKKCFVIPSAKWTRPAKAPVRAGGKTGTVLPLLIRPAQQAHLTK